ncbi:MAG: hypothetical protein ROR55_11335 [Devosia sp.]
MDRSTVGQLLAQGETRLPNAQLAADAAQHLGVSTDWLLGLTEAARSLADEQLLEWHREAAGYKIRHVPATMPDMLKTEAVLRWEYEDYIGKTSDQAIQAERDKVDWLATSASDYEIAMPVHCPPSAPMGHLK